ncbi:hypothetical protein FRC04_001813 [Tulasnella sp. 424]|nr:hypothetical protein FRC04_001813 [Tulasnella sp. 424]
MGEARHRQKKRQYARSNKRNFEKQIAMQTKIAENLRFIESRVNAAKGIVLEAQLPMPHGFAADSDAAPSGSLEARYWMSKDSRTPINLSQLLQKTQEDSAFKFLDHVLARLRGLPYSWDEPMAKLKEYSSIELEKDRIYAHGTAQFNYTTYGIRRGQDTIKPALRFTGKGDMVEPENSVRSTVMLSADETDGATIHRRRFCSTQSVAFDMKTEDGGEDYELYYVMRFADRDMAMRHRGGGIGHVDPAQRTEGEMYDGNDEGSESGELEVPPADLREGSEGSEEEEETRFWPVDEFDGSDDELSLGDGVENGSDDEDDVLVGVDDD